MQRYTSEFPSYQVWKQKQGKNPELLIELFDTRDVRPFLAHMRQHEREFGKKCVENDCGGFTAYVGTISVMSPCTTYWWDFIMPDEVINSKKSPIHIDILEKIGEARTMGMIQGRARREAAAAGINYEPGEDA